MSCTTLPGREDVNIGLFNLEMTFKCDVSLGLKGR